jgi:hypothetical protein
MTSDEGLRLLLADPIKREENKFEGKRIVDRLGGLALAIDQTAAYIDDAEIAIEDFLPAYEVERRKILEYTPAYGWEYNTMQLDRQIEEEKALSAFTTWQMSFQQLFPMDPQKQKYALHFLTLYAFLDYLNIAEDLIRIFWQESESSPEWLAIFVKTIEDNNYVAKAHPPNGQSNRSPLSNDIIQRGTKSQNEDIQVRKKWKSELLPNLRTKLRQLSLRALKPHRQEKVNH